MELEVRGLTKQFGPVTAVREVSFTAPAGQVTGLLGPNGSGKTTTLRVALGLVRPNAGTALIGGVPYQSLARPRRTVGAMLEATGLHPGRRARDHLRVLAAAGGEGRMVFTLDRGFGDIRAYPPGTHPGIVVFRVDDQSAPAVISAVMELLDGHDLDALAGAITIVQGRVLRIRR